uniref:Uncharacterized protein n=1 Tax=Oryza meridionalis TaxID=40149 RepID=A0A0E0C2R7_9ORYZ
MATTTPEPSHHHHPHQPKDKPANKSAMVVLGVAWQGGGLDGAVAVGADDLFYVHEVEKRSSSESMSLKPSPSALPTRPKLSGKRKAASDLVWRCRRRQPRPAAWARHAATTTRDGFVAHVRHHRLLGELIVGAPVHDVEQSRRLQWRLRHSRHASFSSPDQRSCPRDVAVHKTSTIVAAAPAPDDGGGE